MHSMTPTAERKKPSIVIVALVELVATHRECYCGDKTIKEHSFILSGHTSPQAPKYGLSHGGQGRRDSSSHRHCRRCDGLGHGRYRRRDGLSHGRCRRRNGQSYDLGDASDQARIARAGARSGAC